ncbi:hypothetical protein MNBD_GAMMA12-3543 [hydrothermal vent metagenome]|uniref:Uncharacterized protein n=1 Tax=hydrothermal vent metagenome TaxID=652676 RepID=A0A3B0YN84_9ZZZZ
MFLIYNFIYPIRLAVIAGSEFYLYFILLAQSLFYLKYINYTPRLRFFYPLMYSALLLMCMSIISIYINGSNDYLGVLVIVKYIFAIVMSYIVSIIVIDHYAEDSVLFLIKTMVLSALLISITCALEFFLPSFKAFFAMLIETSGNIEYEESFRVHGLATGGGASLSVGLALSSVLGLFLFEKSNGLKSVFWGSVSLFIFVSTLFVGRTGLFLLLFFYLMYFASTISFRGVLVVILVIVLMYTFVGSVQEEQLNIFYNYSLEPLMNYIENGVIESKTTTGLMSMYYMPDAFHVLFGAGYWRYPTHGYDLSDVGYMKIIMAYGFIGAMVFYSLQLYIYSHAYSFFVKRYKFKIGFLFIFYVLFIAELKEEFFVQNYAFKILILLAVFSFSYKAFCNKMYLK